jgi:hypothetical protein
VNDVLGGSDRQHEEEAIDNVNDVLGERCVTTRRKRSTTRRGSDRRCERRVGGAVEGIGEEAIGKMLERWGTLGTGGFEEF